MIWYSKRGKWKRGPDFPQSFPHNDDFCATSVNSTSIVFIGGHAGDGTRKNVSIFHMNLNKWISLADVNVNKNHNFEKCAATTVFSKESGKPQIYAIICKCKLLYCSDFDF